jgi:hypothetical protein
MVASSAALDQRARPAPAEIERVAVEHAVPGEDAP